MLDILITGGRYPDYGEGKFKRANIGIRDGKIAYIGVRTPEAAQTIDARGQIVSPGLSISTCMRKTCVKATGG